MTDRALCTVRYSLCRITTCIHEEVNILLTPINANLTGLEKNVKNNSIRNDIFICPDVVRYNYTYIEF